MATAWLSHCGFASTVHDDHAKRDCGTAAVMDELRTGRLRAYAIDAKLIQFLESQTPEGPQNQQREYHRVSEKVFLCGMDCQM